MRRVLAVEVRRALARRLVRVLLLLAVAVLGLVTVAVFTNTEELPPTATFLHQHVEEEMDACIDAARTGEGLSLEDARDRCRDEIDQEVSIEEARDRDPRFLVSLWPRGNESRGLLMIPASFVLVGALVAGASTTGAEWRAGTMSTALTWEPRRDVLMTGKLLAAGLVAAVLAIGLTVAFGLAFLPTVLQKGTTAGIDNEWWTGLAGGLLRIGAAAGLASILGAALASLIRSTAGANAVTLGWLVAGETVMRLSHPEWDRWFLVENAGMLITGGDVAARGFTRSALGAGLLLAAYVLATVIVSIVSFRNRDVTGDV